MATEAEVVDILLEMRPAWPGFRPENPEGLIRAYSAGLKRLDTGAIRAGARRAMETRKFFPSLAELLADVRSAAGERVEYAADWLIEQRGRLEEDLADGKFDPADWLALAEMCERAGRISTAGMLREKAAAYAQLMGVAA